MSKEIYISSTPHETRLAIVEQEQLSEIYYERENEYTLAGSIYKGRVTRVLPGMQSSFVDVGLERDAFLYVTDFMEEVGESADFETTDGNGARSRGRGHQRGDVSQGEAGGGDLRAPERRSAEQRSQEPRNAEPRTAELREGRGQDGSHRDGRVQDGRLQGGRSRDGRGGRNRRDERVNFQPAQPAPLEATQPANEAIPTGADAGELGEGAPGADGTRRWRGRRGRRRGRGGLGTRGEGSATPAIVPSEAYAEPVDAFAETLPTPTAERYPSREQHATGEPSTQTDAPERYVSRRSRSGEQARFEQSTPAQELALPLILPGESLSKYQRGEQAPSAQQAAGAGARTVTPLAQPSSTVFDLGSSWDGGKQLPGESLSRHRGGSSNSSSEVPRSPEAPRNAFQSTAPSPESFSGQTAATAPPPLEHEESQLEPFFPTPAPDDVTPEVSSPQAVEAPKVPEPSPAGEAPSAASESITDVALDPAADDVEYEPKEAAASYRVDPSAPSEYRQSSLDEEIAGPGQPVPAPLVEADSLALVVEEEAPWSWVGNDQSSAAAPEEPQAQTSGTGEAATEALAVLPRAEEQELVGRSEVEQGNIAELHHLSAVGGVMEEEIIDGEEYDFELIETSSDDHEMDDLEEETLDGAADLGTMVRDMHLEERTRSKEPDSLDEDFVPSTHEEQDFGQPSYSESTSEMGADTDLEEDTDVEDNEEDDLDGGEGRTLEGEAPAGDAVSTPSERRGRREGGRRGSRDGRRSGGDRGGDHGGDRRRGGPGGGGRGRQSMQMNALPIISDLLKPGQEILVQIAKEPMAKKGARITSHIALPGRFLVFMPTVNHVGVSRKIESDEERHRLKRILLSEKGEAAGGFIVRTAADGASEDELRSDLRFLINLWSDIKTRSDSSKAPALIYHDLNLVERILRDQVTDTFSAIWVDTEAEYERVLRFLQRFQPSLIRRVKLYTKETPLFEQFGITDEINNALKSKVWLKSGGSIVINQTEALVAIDINTGKYVGKTARLEDTIVKTNLDAIPEIVRQIRLRDLGGIIVIDFIDMDDRKNRNRVMQALEDELKNDRAPSKVLHFNDFGLVAITRKRVKQSLERTLSVPCAVCSGTGMTKSPVTVCNEIYIEMRKMHKHLERPDIMLRVHPEVVKQLKSSSGRWLIEMEEMASKTILVKSDPSLQPEQFDIH